jgi:subtilisin family serine protease
MRIDGQHTAMQGTSMACPVATGLVALLLEGDPYLTPADIRARLTSAATIPGAAAGIWNPTWGYGEVDARRL